MRASKVVSLVLEGLLRPGLRREHGLLASDLGTSVWIHFCILKEGELGACFSSPLLYPSSPVGAVGPHRSPAGGARSCRTFLAHKRLLVLFVRVPNASPLQFPLKEPHQQNKTRTARKEWFPLQMCEGMGAFQTFPHQGRVMGQGSLFPGVSRGENWESGEQGKSAMVLCKGGRDGLGGG